MFNGKSPINSDVFTLTVVNNVEVKEVNVEYGGSLVVDRSRGERYIEVICEDGKLTEEETCYYM